MTALFREKSLEQIKTPDHLDTYIRVSNPSVWLILAAIVLLLVAGAVWAVFGTIAETAPGVLVVRDGAARCYVEQSKVESLDAGDTIEAAGAHGMVTSSPAAAELASQAEATDGKAEAIWGTQAWVVSAEASIDLPDGVYESSVTLKAYEPLALLFGGK